MALIGRLVDRPNRFVFTVERPDGSRVRAYCPNTSRLVGLVRPGVPLWIEPNDDPERKTDYTATRIRDGETWVGIEARRANALFENYVRSETDERHRESGWQSEVFLADSQIDFLGRSPDGRPHWMEVKSLSSGDHENGTHFAFYSGTPSRRGYRHLKHLSEAVKAGHRASCVFVVQRPDVSVIRPGRWTEEGWLNALRTADRAGVSIEGLRCGWDGEDRRLRVDGPIEARLE